jgi:hypothetical protein
MAQNSKIIIEGSYNYFQKGHNFSQENFKLYHLPDAQMYYISAEIFSRMESGEFLKIIVRYEMNNHFLPVCVRIEKSIGSKFAQELFVLNTQNNELSYNFQSAQQSHEFKKTVSPKHYLTSPAVSTSAFFTMTRKFDATGRTPVILISSENEWNYSAAPLEKMIYAEFKTRELSDFKLNGTNLAASLLCLYEHDSMNATSERPVELYLSKHYNIPYQLSHEEQKMVINRLKKNT